MDRQKLIEEISKKVKPLVIGDRENEIITTCLDIINKQEKKSLLHIGTQKRELFYNFITWYNARPKVKKQEGLITTNIIEDYLKL